MSTQTNKLGLFKYDPIVDKEELFDIQEALNDNWDKIDTAIVQSDWNQNDPEAPDYVKNRTHYVEPRYDEEFNGEVTFPRVSLYNQIDTIMLEGGAKYRVVFDNVEYVLEAVPTDKGAFTTFGGWQIGNLTDYPFRIISGMESIGYEYIRIIEAQETYEGTYHLVIEKITEIVTPLDEKFLPDTVATKADIEAAIGAANDVFFATYGTTTLSEILTAYTSGKNIVCSYPDKNLFANLTKVQATKWVPAAVDGTSYTGETVTIPSINMMPTEFEYVSSAVDQYRVTTATGVYPFSFGDADEVIVAKSDTSIVEGLSITRNGNLMGFQSDNWDAMGSKTAALKIESLANTSVDDSDVECTITFSAALDNNIVVLTLSADGSWSSTSSKLADVEYVDSAIGAAIGGSY